MVKFPYVITFPRDLVPLLLSDLHKEHNMEKELNTKENEGRREEVVTERARIIGDAMRKDRKDARYTIREMAKLLDLSATHLNRMENGYRLLDSIETLIRFCEILDVPIDKYLRLCGMTYKDSGTAVSKAFPAVESQDQENAITAFAQTITSRRLTADDLAQILDNVTAYADFCTGRNKKKESP